VKFSAHIILIPKSLASTETILTKHVRRVCATLLMITAFCATHSVAQTLADYDYTNLAFRGIGFDYGYIWPSKVAPTPTYGVRLDLGFLGPGVRVTPSLTYWSSEFRSTEVDRLASQINRLPALQGKDVTVTRADLGTIKWSDVSLGLDAHMLWTTAVGIFTYVGAGVSVHALNGQGTFIQNTFVEDLLDSTAAGVNIVGGLEFQPVQRLRVYGEARYTIVSDVRYPGIRVGGALMLPPRDATNPR
jgi:hypothetical protein